MEFFRKNVRVTHAQLGAGVVIEANRRYTTIAFDDGAVRKFVTELVRLERSARPVPVRETPPSARRPRRHDPLKAQKTAS
jgi:hypothetical protein